jgi:hypothetical protein
MDSLITALILLVVSALATWLKKKGAEPGDGDSSPGSQQTPTPRPLQRPTNWEEELRRMLAGQPPAEPPPGRPTPPPTKTTPWQTPPPVVIRPVLVSQKRPTVVSTPRAVPAPPPVPSSVEMSAGRMAPMTESKTAYDRASQLDKKVAEHIGRVSGQRVLATTVVRREASPELAQAVSLFKNARTARQAVIASIILGRPRSLEEFSLGY